MQVAEHIAHKLPARWQRRLDRTLSQRIGAIRFAHRDSHFAETSAVRAEVEAFAKTLTYMPLAPNASDSEVVAFADAHAKECRDLMADYRNRFVDGPHDRRSEMRALCEKVARRATVRLVAERIEHGPAIARYCDESWWRRRVRESFGRKVEEGAIRLGMVHRPVKKTIGERRIVEGDIYLSDESMNRRRQQNRRNARILENTQATNERGDTYTLAELANLGVSNPVIRRKELMLRMRGLEEVAKEMGFVGLFAVLTCPGRMHAVLKDGRPNDKFDGTSPRQAQEWHATQWKRATAALHRSGIDFFGVRTVEPHHDGTPHWNLLLFVPGNALVSDRTEYRFRWGQGTDEVRSTRSSEPSGMVERILKHYWLDTQDPDAEGAQQHRVRFERIDPDKGSATAYIAKYIAKNVDGFAMSEDLFGTPILEATERAQAWARLWGIRQFQTICSAQVTVWRELRRIPSHCLVGCPAPLTDAWLAAQKFGDDDDSETDRAIKGTKGADFAEYIRAFGGPRVKKSRQALVLARRAKEGLTRYGENRPPAPCGVMGTGICMESKGGIVGLSGAVHSTVLSAAADSVRHEWTISRGSGAGAGAGAGSKEQSGRTTGAAGTATRRGWHEPGRAGDSAQTLGAPIQSGSGESVIGSKPGAARRDAKSLVGDEFGSDRRGQASDRREVRERASKRSDATRPESGTHQKTEGGEQWSRLGASISGDPLASCATVSEGLYGAPSSISALDAELLQQSQRSASARQEGGVDFAVDFPWTRVNNYTVSKQSQSTVTWSDCDADGFDLGVFERAPP